MVSLAPEDDSNAFVGQVFTRSSPVLTWRPALAARAERQRAAAENPEEISGASLVEPSEASFRLSRAPTRKMIAWPVQKRVRRETSRVHERRRLVSLLASGVVVAAALLIAVAFAKLAQGRGVARVEPPATRVLVTHVASEPLDTLAAPADATLATGKGAAKHTATARGGGAVRTGHAVAQSAPPKASQSARPRGGAHRAQRPAPKASKK